MFHGGFTIGTVNCIANDAKRDRELESVGISFGSAETLEGLQIVD
jgi:hypothetical protein